MSLNKKSIYEQSFSRDMLLRTNKETVTNIPNIIKVDISISHSTVALNKKQLLPILTALEILTGQKPTFVRSKKLVPQYNIRKGALIGAKVTLKGNSVYNFLENLILLVLPKLPIDSYFNSKSISKYGNISLTIREPLDFFELEREFEKFSKIPNININIHTTAMNKHEGLSLLSYLNIPFK